MARRVIAVRDPRECECCSWKISDGDLRAYRIEVDGVDAETGEPIHQGFPRVCEDCAHLCPCDGSACRAEQRVLVANGADG